MPGSRVAVECGYGRDYLIALLAVWLAGATAVPLDPASPAERRLFQVRRAGCDAAVTGPGVRRSHRRRGSRTPAGRTWTRPSRRRTSCSPRVRRASPRASWSSTRPWSGCWTASPAGWDSVAVTRMVAHSNPVFDMSMFETVLPLVIGGCLAVAPARSARNPEIFANWLLVQPGGRRDRHAKPAAAAAAVPGRARWASASSSAAGKR